MNVLEETLAAIAPLDHAAAKTAGERLDSLTKPLGSLGYLEEIVRRYAAIRHDASAAAGRGAIAVFVADHGVTEEGISAYPKSVTVEMLRNIARGGAAISVLARRMGFELIVTDVGVAADTSVDPFPGVVYRRVAPGTRNFTREAAMSLAEAQRAIEIGIEIAREASARGITLLGIGEMGIGNSTAAAAILSALSAIAPARLAGRGTGLDDEGFRRKVQVIETGLRYHNADRKGPLALLAALGGFEIAAMVGVCLGGAAANVPTVVDGFIATAAAVVAEKLRPGLYDYLFFGHRSAEGGHSQMLESIGARPILDLDMRLGEGTGAALAMMVIESALGLFHQMATFADAGVSEKLQ